MFIAVFDILLLTRLRYTPASDKEQCRLKHANAFEKLFPLSGLRASTHLLRGLFGTPLERGVDLERRKRGSGELPAGDSTL